LVHEKSDETGKNETKKTIYLNVQSAIILTLFPSPSFGYGDFLFIFLNIYSDKKNHQSLCEKNIQKIRNEYGGWWQFQKRIQKQKK